MALNVFFVRVGIYLNAAATGNFLFAVYGPMSDNLYFQPGSKRMRERMRNRETDRQTDKHT